MAFKDRLKQARLEKGVTQEQLGEQIGVAKSTITGYEKGNSEPDMLKMKKIMRALNIDANYLLQDEMKQSADNNTSLEELKLLKKYRVLDERGKKIVNTVLNVEYENYQSAQEEPDNVISFHVPEYYQTVSAGGGDWNDDNACEDLLLIKPPPKGTAFVVRVNGDSMEPTFQHGDRLFIRPQFTLEDGQIGIFVMDSCMYVKELRKGHLISHNPEYDPIPLNESARCQGRVLGVCDNSYFEK